jgi:hypothetical protein
MSGEIKTFQDKYKLKQSINTKAVLQKILRGIQHEKGEERQL